MPSFAMTQLVPFGKMSRNILQLVDGAKKETNGIVNSVDSLNLNSPPCAIDSPYDVKL